MPTPLETLIATGTKLWLDSVDPEELEKNVQWGATGATSNPVIVSDLIKTGRFDEQLATLLEQHDDEAAAWRITDQLVADAQEHFVKVHEQTDGDDGYVSFELDPLIDEAEASTGEAERTERYIELGKQWSDGHTNRMIKVPATPAGLGALEELAAAGVTLNITLIFSDRQYREARDAIWRGAQRRKDPASLKSVYSIFISRIDVYTDKQVTDLSQACQGQVGLLNVKRIWAENEEFWADKKLPRNQEIIFASTGVKKENDPPDKYVSALAGSGIQTNPPATNSAIQEMEGKAFFRTVDRMPPQIVQDEIDKLVDFDKMEQVLMEEGLRKFSEPQRVLLELIEQKRASVVGSAS